MSNQPEQHEESSWANNLCKEYVEQYREYICQSYISELEHIDSFVEFMNDDLPHADAIWKKRVYNVKRIEKNEQRRKDRQERNTKNIRKPR